MKTQEIQKKVVAFCRGNEDVIADLPDVKEKLSIYRKLIQQGIADSLQNAYPITYDLLTPEQWKELVTDFILYHDCKHPSLWKMPEELRSFAKKQNLAKRFGFSYLYDLLEFEWLELEVYMMANVSSRSPSKEGDLLEDQILLNPYYKIKSFTYPVFAMHPLPEDCPKGPYHLIIYRHHVSQSVHFFALSPFYLMVFKALKKGMNGKKALKLAGETFQISDEKTLFSLGKKFMKDLQDNTIIIGFL